MHFLSPLLPNVLSLKRRPALTLFLVHQHVPSQLCFVEALFCAGNLRNQGKAYVAYWI